MELADPKPENNANFLLLILPNIVKETQPTKYRLKKCVFLPISGVF